MPKHCEIELYPEDGWNVEKIQDIIRNHTSIVKYCIALHDQDVQEDGTPVKPHFHVYINAGKTNLNLKNVANWFGTKEQAVEKIKSDKSDKNQSQGMYYTLKYYTHEDIPEKHHYSPNEFVANFDVEQALKDGAEKLKNRGKRRANKQEIEEIYNKCADGTITPENFHKFVSPSQYVNIKSMMERAWQYYEQDYQRATQGFRDCMTIYVYGESGTGKSLLCRLFTKELGLTVYVTAYGEHPFDEYSSEEAIILDDIRPYSPFSHVQLLNLTDPHYLVKAQARYKNKLLKNSFMFITSVLSPQKLWDGFHLNKKKPGEEDDGEDEENEENERDSGKQLYRRLYEVWEVTKTTIHIFKYIDDRFQRINSVPNPVPDYLAQLPASRGEAIKSTDIFDTIHNKFKSEPPVQLSLFDDYAGLVDNEDELPY